MNGAGKNRQHLFYWLFLAVLLVPNLVLCFTERFSLPTAVASLLIPAGFYGILLVIGRRPGVPMLAAIPLMVFGAFQLVVLFLFGQSPIAVDMFTNVFTTNGTEAGELLETLLPVLFFVLCLYVPAIVLAIRSIRTSATVLSARFRLWTVTASAVSILTGLAFGAVSSRMGHSYRFLAHIYPFNVFHNLRRSIDKWRVIGRYPETSSDFSFEAERFKTTGKREIYVLVIGEASRAANWSLYGYGRETNPELSRIPRLVKIPDAITVNNATHKSVSVMVSPVNAENYTDIFTTKSVVTAFKESGFRTIWLSNQMPDHGIVDFFANEADERINLYECLGHSHPVMRPDGEMLPILEQKINTTEEDLFVVLHLYGSHFNYRHRYPDEFAKFKPDHFRSVDRKNKEALVNAYDNSVRYTDHVVSDVIRMLEATGDCTALLFSSDHGEDLMDDNRGRFLHSSPIPTYYQLHIPFLLWFSDTYEQTFPEKYRIASREVFVEPVSTASVFHTLTDMAGIRTPWLDRTYSLVSREIEARERYYLNDHDEAVLFYNMGLAEEDFEKITENSIRYNRLRAANTKK